MSIAELNGARRLVEQDPAMWPQILEGLLPIVNRRDAALRRWCAGFFVDAFATTAVSEHLKQGIALKLVPAITTLLTDGDPQVLKLTITCFSLVYPLLFEYACMNGQEARSLWPAVDAIKQTCSRLWDDNQHVGVQAACIKYAQVIVSTQSKQQTTGLVEVSLLSVPRNHPVLDPVILGAESQGLLDRLVSYLAEPSTHPAKFTATINALLVLVHTRPQMSSKIMQSILSVHLSSKRWDVPPDCIQLSVKYVDKCLQLLLKYVGRENWAPKFNGGIQKFLAEVADFRASANLRKRAAELDEADSSKRVKLAENNNPVNSATSLAAGDVPLANLYRLVDSNNMLAEFNAQELPLEIAVKLALEGIRSANSELLKNCIAVVRQRLQDAKLAPQPKFEEDPSDAPKQATQSEVTEIKAEVAAAKPPAPDQKDEETPFVEAVSFDENSVDGKTTQLIQRVFKASASATSLSLNESSESQGLHRAIVPDWSKDSWVYLMARVATRGCPADSPVAQRIRDYLYNYVMSDFRRHLDTIVVWLSEEWFAENVLMGNDASTPDEGIYYKTLDRIMDQILPRMELNDSKMFIRLLSDVPELNAAIIGKLDSLCRDPERSLLGIRALKFLIMFKPPIKEACLDLAESLHNTGVESVKSVLARYRPKAIEAAA